MSRRTVWGITIVAVAATAFAYLQATDTPPAADPDTPTIATGELADRIHALPATTPARQARLAESYDRDSLFGGGWLDPDGNGCSAREDVLLRDRDGGQPVGCRVSGLVIHDPYTGRTLHGTRSVQIDHVVPLSVAWRSGADRWTSGQRRAFANDPSNLLAVDGPTNMSKGDQTPDEWMPLVPGGWCDYLDRYVHVSVTYRLAVTDTTRDALLRYTARC